MARSASNGQKGRLGLRNIFQSGTTSADRPSRRARAERPRGPCTGGPARPQCSHAFPLSAQCDDCRGDRIVAAQTRVTVNRGRKPSSSNTLLDRKSTAVLSRSSRIIVRFDDGGVDIDPAFDALTPSLACIAGAGYFGLQQRTARETRSAIERILVVTRAWRKAGLPLVHLELAGYASREALDLVLKRSLVPSHLLE